MSYDIRKLQEGGIIRRGGPAHTLIVLVHGLRVTNAQWLPLLSRAAEDSAFEGCDFYAAMYQSGLRSPMALDTLGALLAGSIDLQFTRPDNTYERVVLVGYSIGGLAARAAYLHGVTQQHTWADHVSRIILMASPNRGFGGPDASVKIRMGIWFTRLLSGRPFNDAVAGSDFVTNLRLEWVYAFRDRDNESRPDRIRLKTKPTVIQLLGSRDELVQKNDSNDVTIFADSRLFLVANAAHDDLAKYSDLDDEKYLRFKKCCFSSLADEQGDEEKPTTEPPAAVVFQLHGIRDYGGWLGKFETTIKALNRNVRVVRPGYGYFSLLGFATPWIRRRRISWFCDRYTQEVASLAASDDIPFYFVGHSYGTYLAAECLKRFRSMHFERACLVGSVLPQSFEWTSIIARRQVRGLRNDCASLDWPVGICCQVLNKFGFKDVGVGGFRGFQTGIPEVVEYIHVPGNHSASLTNDKLRTGVAEYLLLDRHTNAPSTVEAPRWLSLASQWAPVLTVATLILAGLGLHQAAVMAGIDWHMAIVALLFGMCVVLVYL